MKKKSAIVFVCHHGCMMSNGEKQRRFMFKTQLWSSHLMRTWDEHGYVPDRVDLRAKCPGCNRTCVRRIYMTDVVEQLIYVQELVGEISFLKSELKELQILVSDNLGKMRKELDAEKKRLKDAIAEMKAEIDAEEDDDEE